MTGTIVLLSPVELLTLSESLDVIHDCWWRWILTGQLRAVNHPPLTFKGLKIKTDSICSSSWEKWIAICIALILLWFIYSRPLNMASVRRQKKKSTSRCVQKRWCELVLIQKRFTSANSQRTAPKDKVQLPWSGVVHVCIAITDLTLEAGDYLANDICSKVF